MKKRVLAIAMSLAMTLSLLPVSALAAEGDEKGNETQTYADEPVAQIIGGASYTTLQEAFENAEADDTVKLLDNVSIIPTGGNAPYLEPQIHVTQNLTLDLNGKSIGFDQSVYETELPYFPLLFSVDNGGILKITGNGTISAECGMNGAYGIDVYGGEVIVENGEFYGAPSAIQVEKGSLTVNGGFFDLAPSNKDKVPSQAKYVVNCIDAAFKDGSATLSVRGGTFVGSDPSDSPEGTGTTYVADGYVSVQDGDQYTVMPMEEAAVAQIGNEYYLTLGKAVTAAESGDKIVLLRSVSGDGIIAQSDDNFVLDLNGKTYTIDRTVGSAGTQTNGMQFLKGAKVTIEDGSIAFNNAKIGIKNYCDLTLNNVILTSTATANPVINNCGQLVVNGAETKITANNTDWAITTGNYHKDDVITTVVNAGEISSIACETPLWQTGGATVNESVTTTINGGTIGKLGVYDWRADYGGDYLNAPLLEKWKMIVTNGCIDTLAFDENSSGKVTISGGYFTSDPSEYLAENYYAVASGKTGYSYMVTSEEPTVAPVIVTENVEAGVAGNADMTLEDKEAVSSVINSASVSGVADVLTDKAKNNIVKDANISSDVLADPEKTVVIEIGVNVTATSADLSEDNATVTYQVTPVATVKVNGEEQPEKVSVPNSYLNGQKFTVRLPLPEGLKEPREVMHIDDNGVRERFTGDELTIGSNWVEVSISHFSELIVNAKETVAAKIGNTEYGTLQEAVSAAKSGDVITLQQDCNEPITISGKSMTINKNGYRYSDSLVSVGANCTKTVSGRQIIVTYTAPSRPSGGGSSSSDSGDYLITVDRVSGGRVTVQPGRADKGDTVTITVYPNDGYELDELVVTDSRGNEIDLDARSATRFTFTMPGGKVTVEASFVREGGQPQVPQTTFADVPASAWYYDAVEYVYENGLMSGVSGGRFAPNDTLTRAMLVQTLYAMEGRPAAASAGFADVASGDWYASAVNWAAANGVVSGVSETGFGPNNALTREQLALILYRFAQYKGYDVTGTSDLAAYADGSSVSNWAAEAMGWAVDAGLISGVGGNQIAPTGTASRAQVAQILMNFCENVAR